jgi:excisionase family DNA binding protein
MEKLVLTVREFAKLMQISMPSAYDMTERRGFPLIRIGRKKLIPVEPLKAWLAQESGVSA